MHVRTYLYSASRCRGRCMHACVHARVHVRVHMCACASAHTPPFTRPSPSHPRTFTPQDLFETLSDAGPSHPSLHTPSPSHPRTFTPQDLFETLSNAGEAFINFDRLARWSMAKQVRS